MKTKSVSPNDIFPFLRNPRVIPAIAVDKVARSIEMFGFRQPIVVDANFVIVVGHTRHLAAKQLGLAKVPVIIVTDKTDEELDAYRIVDNRSSEFTNWDMTKVKEQVDKDNELDEFFTDDFFNPPDSATQLTDWDAKKDAVSDYDVDEKLAAIAETTSMVNFNAGPFQVKVSQRAMNNYIKDVFLEVDYDEDAAFTIIEKRLGI